MNAFIVKLRHLWKPSWLHVLMQNLPKFFLQNFQPETLGIYGIHRTVLWLLELGCITSPSFVIQKKKINKKFHNKQKLDKIDFVGKCFTEKFPSKHSPQHDHQSLWNFGESKELDCSLTVIELFFQLFQMITFQSVYLGRYLLSPFSGNNFCTCCNFPIMNLWSKTATFYLLKIFVKVFPAPIFFSLFSKINTGKFFIAKDFTKPVSRWQTLFN